MSKTFKRAIHSLTILTSSINEIFVYHLSSIHLIAINGITRCLEESYLQAAIGGSGNPSRNPNVPNGPGRQWIFVISLCCSIL